MSRTKVVDKSTEEESWEDPVQEAIGIDWALGCEPKEKLDYGSPFEDKPVEIEDTGEITINNNLNYSEGVPYYKGKLVQGVKNPEDSNTVDDKPKVCLSFKGNIIVPYTGPDFIKINRKEEINIMNNPNRRTVTIELMDDDAGLPVENSLVATYSNIVTEDTNEITIQQLLMDEDVADKIKEHNLDRGKVNNLDILSRTGQYARLGPVKLKQLRWVVK